MNRARSVAQSAARKSKVGTRKKPPAAQTMKTGLSGKSLKVFKNRLENIAAKE